MSETVAEEVARLQREIAERQVRLRQLVCGDRMLPWSSRVRVEMTPQPFEPVILHDEVLTRGRIS